MTNNKSTWGSAASGQVQNAAVITFAQASGDWASGANLGYWAIFDNSTGGNMIAYGTVTTPKPVLNGDTPSIAISACTITLT